MGGVELLAQARALGLEVTEWNGRLRIYGPKEHEDMALRLVEHRPGVLEVLRYESDATTHPRPTTCCRTCGGQAYWRRSRGHWLCDACHPAPCVDVVAEQHEVACLPRDAWHTGLSEEVVDLLTRHEWEPIVHPETAPDFPDDAAPKDDDGGDSGF
jgi:hypothetical protein